MNGWLSMLSSSSARAGKPEWLVVGLGNPGATYEKTRHNIGFDVLDALADRHILSWSNSRHGHALEATTVVGEQACLLFKPQTYMNLSGKAVRPVMDFYKIPPEKVLVLYDDISLAWGRIRVRPSGSAGGHNGMKSIIQHLGGNEKFPRLRIGVSAPPPGMPLEQYVLGRFKPEEVAIRPQVIDLALEALTVCLKDGITNAQNKFNAAQVNLTAS
jgi:PTH1 family peptidyl-tRNA hydrolase